MGEVWLRCAVSDDTVYFISLDKNIYALTRNGRLKWRFKTGNAIGTSILLANNTLYFGSRDNYFYAVGAETGDLRWKFKAQSIIFETASVHKGVLYFAGCDNILYAIDEKTGGLIWKFKTNVMASSIPAIYNDVVYFGSWDCNLYAVTTEGKLLWKFPTSLSYQSPIEIEDSALKTKAEITWKPEISEEKKAKGDEVDIADYGTFSGTYIDTSKTDYLGRKKKGYK
ncbi:MAG: PQQ-like beta-propeller repeat protein, partial [Candidatus Aenigmatarchaeota archaeon]